MNAKQTIWTAVLVVAAAAGGWIASQRLAPSAGGPAEHAQVGSGPCPGGAKPAYWKAPMDPTYIRNEPGKSPMGMDLVPVCQGEEGASPEGTVKIATGVLQNMGVETAVVERRDLTRVVRAVGRVDYDERLVAHVHTKIQGWVEKLYVEYEGEMVKRGQPLLEIYSPELVSTQEELLIAARYRDSTSESPFADVKHGGEDLFEATRRRLELWDIPDRDIDRLLASGTVRKTLTLYAPASGVVTHLMVRKGMEVASNDNLYTIADLSHVWVYADVYEYELPWIAAGQRAVIELSYLPGVKLEGTVTYVYPYLDPKTRTARVRVELDNPDLVLKPDMFANVRIEAETRKNVLAVPSESVIHSGRRNLVIVALGGGRFQPRDVTLGIDTGEGWVEVRDGLRKSERVVTSGQFLIDSESKLQEAVQKLLAADSGAGAQPEKGTPHEGHAMPEGGMSDEGHTMPEGDMSHEGPAMPETGMSHEGHAMPEGGTSHEGHDMHSQPAED